MDDSFFCGDIAEWLQPTIAVSAPSETATHAHTKPHTPASTSSSSFLGSNEGTRDDIRSRIPSARFGLPKTDAEIVHARQTAIPAKTMQDTKYCVGVFEEWRKYRITTGAHIKELTNMTKAELQHWLIRFVLEVRKQNGDVYPPSTLHHLCSGIMRHLRWSGRPELDIFKDVEFCDFRGTLDAEMKRLQEQGVGSVKRQAEILTEADEETLWEKGLLGDSTPQSLVDTMVFYIGYYFALRSGKEHRQLRRSPSQIQIVEHPGERPFLRYTEDISKNHPGGLKGRNIKPKIVVQHANLDNPQRCFVRLFKLYVSLCPSDAPPHAFYLRPAQRPSEHCWYSKFPLGHTTLSRTVARLCDLAGIPGFKTNHSLRATVTSRLYQSGVDEQLLMERTGHRSLEGVRSYKRTSDSQREMLSDILNHCPSSSRSPSTRPTKPKQPSTTPVTAEASVATFMSASQNSHSLQGLSLPSATFNCCTVNFSIVHPTATTANCHRFHEQKKRRRVIIESDSDSD